MEDSIEMDDCTYSHDEPEHDPLATDDASEPETTSSTSLPISSATEMFTCTQCSSLYMKNMDPQNCENNVCSLCRVSQTSAANESAVTVKSLIYTTAANQSEDILQSAENIDINEIESSSNCVFLPDTVMIKEEVLENCCEEEGDPSTQLDTAKVEEESVPNCDEIVSNQEVCGPDYEPVFLHESMIKKEEEEIIDNCCEGEENSSIQSDGKGEEEEEEEEEEVPNSENDVVSDRDISGLQLEVYEPGKNDNPRVEDNADALENSLHQETNNSDKDKNSEIPKRKTQIIYEYKAEKIDDPVAKTLRHLHTKLQFASGRLQFNSTLMYIHCGGTCKEDYLNLDYYETHLVNRTKCRCPICSRYLSDMNYLQFLQHVQGHINMLFFKSMKGKKCVVCEKKMISPANYILHLKNMHPSPVKTETPVVSKSVEVVAKPPEDPKCMVDDIKTFLFELPYDTNVHCSQCSEDIQVDKFLDEHLSKCTDNNKFTCHLCSNHEQQDSYPDTLTQIYQHFVEIRHIFKCSLCRHSFLTYENHRLHFQCMHNEESKNSKLYTTAILVPPFKNECQVADTEAILVQLEGTSIVNLTPLYNLLEKRMVKVRLDIRINSCPCNVHCYACKKDLSRKEFFETHVEKLPNPDDHPVCVFCGNDISKLSQQKYLKHLTIHFMMRYPKVHRCKTCKIDYFSVYNRSIHMKDEHDIEEEIYTKRKGCQEEAAEATTSNLSGPSENQNVSKSTAHLTEMLQYMRKLLVYVSNHPIYVFCATCGEEYYFEDFFSKHLFQCGSRKSYKCLYCKVKHSDTSLLKYFERSLQHLTNLKHLMQCQECDHVFLSDINHKLHVNKTHPYTLDPEVFPLPIKLKVPCFVEKEEVQEQKQPVVQEGMLSRSKKADSLKPQKRQRTQVSYADLHHGFSRSKKPKKEATSKKNDEPQISENTEQNGEPQISENTEQNGEPQISENTEQNDEPQISENTEQNGEPQISKNTEQNGEPQMSENTEQNDEPQISENTEQNDEPQISENTEQNDEPQMSENTEVEVKSSSRRKQSFTNLRAERWKINNEKTKGKESTATAGPSSEYNTNQTCLPVQESEQIAHPTAMSTTFNNRVIVQRMEMVEVASILPEDTREGKDGSEADSQEEDEIQLEDEEFESMETAEPGYSTSGYQYLIIDETEANLIAGHFLDTNTDNILE